MCEAQRDDGDFHPAKFSEKDGKYFVMFDSDPARIMPLDGSRVRARDGAAAEAKVTAVAPAPGSKDANGPVPALDTTAPTTSGVQEPLASPPEAQSAALATKVDQKSPAVGALSVLQTMCEVQNGHLGPETKRLIEKLGSIASAMENANATLGFDAKSFEGRLESLQSALDAVQKTQGKLEEENKALHESNRNLNEENKSLRARVQGLERGFNSLVGHLTLTPHALKASDTADSNGQV